MSALHGLSRLSSTTCWNFSRLQPLSSSEGTPRTIAAMMSHLPSLLGEPISSVVDMLHRLDVLDPGDLFLELPLDPELQRVDRGAAPDARAVHGDLHDPVDHGEEGDVAAVRVDVGPE